MPSRPIVHVRVYTVRMLTLCAQTVREALAKAEETFAHFDRDADGFVSPLEFAAGVARLGLTEEVG